MSEILSDVQRTLLEHNESLEQIDYVANLQELFQVSDGVVSECRPKLWASAESVSARLINPDLQRALAIYTGVLDWHYFAKPNDPLPEGLVMTADSDGDLHLSLDYRLPHIDGGLGYVDHALNSAGLRDNMRPYLQEMTDREPAIKEAIRSLIMSSADYQLLNSFDDSIIKPAQAPLPPYWRQIREQQIELSLRERYGYSPNEPVYLNSPMQFELRRELYRLDEETALSTEDPDNSSGALQRACTYLTPFVARAYEDEYVAGEKKFGRIVYEPGDGTYILGEDEELGDAVHDLWELSKAAAEELSSNIFIGDERLKYLVMDFVSVAIDKILDPRATEPYRTVLEEAVNEAVEHITENLYELIRPSEMNIAYGFNESAIIMRAPNSEAFSQRLFDSLRHQSLGRDSWSSVFRSTSELASEAQLWQEENLQIGKVEKYRPMNYRTSARLVQDRIRSEPVGSRSTEEDLVIDLSFPNDPYAVPFIPGYQLVSISPFYDRYGFRVDPEGDPYQECKVVINKARKETLANSYRSVGLVELAQHLEATPKLTVSQLTEFIRSASTYNAPIHTTGGMSGDHFTSNFTRVDYFSDFSKIVRDGKLFVQCTGVANFLKHSLQIAFGPNCAALIGGKVIKSSSETISNTGHAQTVFVHNNRQYILDSTPAYSLSNGSDEPIGTDTEHYRNRRAPLAPKLALADHDQKTATALPKSGKTLDERVSDLITSLVERAKVAFNLPDEEKLFKALVELPQSDPARMTFELLLQFQRGKHDLEDINRKSDYIEHCSEASQDSRDRLGFGQYSVGFLDQLRSTVWKFKWAYEEGQSPT